CIVRNHLPTNGKKQDTRQILNEAHTVAYFPHSAVGKIKYMFEEYVGSHIGIYCLYEATEVQSLHYIQALPAVLLVAEREVCWT
ncbi:MAG: hypothetical protein ACKPKO_56745, partial [Candidatus Fonsibacter sp.]